MNTHSHDHAHAGHSHGTDAASFGRAFAIGTLLNMVFVVAQVFFGWRAHSLALLADAGHNLGDVLGLVLAWSATRLAKAPPTARRTYGLGRSSILAALANAILLLVAVGAITWEAVRRFAHPEMVAGNLVMLVAALGILINGATALMFFSGRKGDLNIKGAFLHMTADAAVSAGVVLAALVILRTGWQWIDPVTSLIINAVIIWGTWGLLRGSLAMALDAVPENVDPSAVRDYLARQPGVTAVHDLHIWPLSTTETALSAHLVKPDAVLDDSMLARLCNELEEQFAIGHVTVQLECGDAAHPCRQESEGVV